MKALDEFGSLLDSNSQPRPANERISWRSRLAPLPRSLARSSHPTGASGGSGEGERFPLVGQSERRLERFAPWLFEHVPAMN